MTFTVLDRDTGFVKSLFYLIAHGIELIRIGTVADHEIIPEGCDILNVDHLHVMRLFFKQRIHNELYCIF